MPQPTRRQIAESISQPGRRLQVCEPRLALSASLAADFLLSSLAPNLHGGGESDWLFDQAQAVRQLYGIDGAGQTIAVIDSGAAWDHVALGGGFGPGYRVVGGWDFAENDADPYDDGPAGFHGTHVAGLISGNGGGFSGVAPGADLVALRVFDDAGQGSLDRIEAALQWVHTNRNAMAHPITTVNLSLGAFLSDEMSGQVQAQLEDELQLLHSDGILVIAAAGNKFDAAAPDRVHYPASSPWVAAVGSIDASSGALSAFSQRESGILVAPGQNVRSSVPDHVLGWDGMVDDFVAAAGTSMAAPQISAAAALVRQAMTASGGDATPADIVQHLRATATAGIDQVSGLTYHVVDLQRAIEALIGDRTGGSEEPAAEHSGTGGATDIPTGAAELGTIDSLQTSLKSDQWYRLQPSRSGLLSFRFADELAAELVLCDADGSSLRPLDSGHPAQLDFAVTEQQPLLIRLSGGGNHGVQLVNLVGIEDGRVTVDGTEGSDDVHLDLSDGVRVDVHGARYGMAAFVAAGWAGADGARPALVIDGGDGSDTLRITGSVHAERLVLRAPTADAQASGDLSSGLVDAPLRGFESVRFTGGGGPDRATLYDAAGTDTLHAYPGQAKLSGVGYAMEVEQVPRVYVHATGGGEDTAFLYDSAGDDTLAVRPQFTSLRSNDHFNLAYGFERVYAYATAGGSDQADLYDSAGDDQMTAAPTAAWISGSGYYASARHFETVVGHATAGGRDTASLYAQSEAATWTRTPDLVQMNEAAGQVRAARGFEQTATYLAGQPIQVTPLAWSSPAPWHDEPPGGEADPAVASEAPPRRPAPLPQSAWQPAAAPPTLSGETAGRGGESLEAAILADLFARFGED